MYRVQSGEFVYWYKGLKRELTNIIHDNETVVI